MKKRNGNPMPLRNVLHNAWERAGRRVRTALRFGLPCVFVLAVLAAAGCRTIFGGGPSIPELETAREQAEVAQQQHQRARQTIDTDQRRQELQRAAAAWQKVVDRFPDDQRYTPAAHLRVGDVHRELEQHRRAERTYREVINRYPDIEDIHALALLYLGETLYAREQHDQGKSVFRQLLDIYGEDNDPQIQDIVARADFQYRQIF